jgi:hypothetical protein
VQKSTKLLELAGNTTHLTNDCICIAFFEHGDSWRIENVIDLVRSLNWGRQALDQVFVVNEHLVSPI